MNTPIVFGSRRNLLDTSRKSYERYLEKEYRDKACCGITPNMFIPGFQDFVRRLMGIESYQEWQERISKQNQFTIIYNTSPVARLAELVPEAELSANFVSCVPVEALAELEPPVAKPFRPQDIL